jgi:hypothetical protein
MQMISILTSRIALGLGEQQSALQGGEGSQREPVDVGVASC